MRRSRFSLFGLVGEIARSTVFPEDLAKSKRQFVLIYFIRLLFLVGRRVWQDRCPRQAAALAYQTFLSIVPLLALALAVASSLELDGYIDKVEAYLEAHLLPAAASEAGRHVVSLVNAIRPKTLGILGGATLVGISMMMLFTIEQVVNEIFRCARARKFWLRILTALVLMLLAPLAFGLSIYFTGKLFSLPKFATAPLPPLFTIIALFLCYWRLPHTKINVRHAFVSALVAGFFLEVIKLIFALYAQYLGATLSYIYGTMVILPLFMIWVYLMWLIFLFGAELNAALHEVKRHDRFEDI